MRKFAIENAAGQRYELNGGDIFFSDPAGLGMESGLKYADLGNGFFKSLETESTPQGSVTGDLVFLRSAYAKYREFVDWLQASSALTLIYAPDGREYHREVTVSFLTKTELKLGRWLYVPASFACLTPWYLPTPLRLSMTKQASNAMRYPFRYAGSLIYGSSSAGSMTAEISPDGHYPAALRFEYSGAAVDPVLTLRGEQSGKIFGQCKINGSFASGDRLIVSTTARDSYVKKISAGGAETDLIYSGAVDIAAQPFPRVPVNEACLLQISAEDSLNGQAEAQVFYYYRSV